MKKQMRQKEDEGISYTIRLPKDLWDKFKTSKVHDKSLNQHVVDIIRKEVEKL